MRFRIGVMVLASLLVAAILLILFGETWNPFQPTYRVRILFPEAPGVSEGTPIRRSGVTIGRVAAVTPLDEGGVEVIAEIQGRVRLRHDQICRVSTNLLGDSILNFIQSYDPRAEKTPVAEGETLHGVVAPDPITLVADMQERLSAAIGSVARTADQLNVVIRKVSTLLDQNEQRINSVVAKADDTMTILHDTVRHADEMISDPQVKQQLKDSIEQIPLVLQEVRNALAKFNEAVTLMDRNLENIEGFTRPLGEKGPAIVSQLNQSVNKLDEVMGQMAAFTQAINSRDGTLGQVIHNRELYDNLNRAAARIENLTEQLQPIVRDARVFSDKIARHPETLGVRGVLDRNPGTKGVPTFAPLR